MASEAPIKTPIPKTSGFRNFALCTLTFAFSTWPSFHKTPENSAFLSYKAARLGVASRSWEIAEKRIVRFNIPHFRFKIVRSVPLCLCSFAPDKAKQLFNSFYAKQSQFPKSQVNVNPYNTMAYGNKSDWTLGENKPNSKPIKPNLPDAQNEHNLSNNSELYQ